jgi:hypothetical protein
LDKNALDQHDTARVALALTKRANSAGRSMDPEMSAWRGSNRTVWSVSRQTRAITSEAARPSEGPLAQLLCSRKGSGAMGLAPVTLDSRLYHLRLGFSALGSTNGVLGGRGFVSASLSAGGSG